MDAAGIYARESPYLERFIQIGVASGRLINVSFPRTPDDEAGTDHPLLDRIDRYLEGTTDSFADVEVATTIPTNQRAVLDALRQVPYGDQVSVDRLASMTPDLDPDDETDIDHVRQALAANPVPLVIPDHRVRDGPSAAPPDVEQKLRSLERL